MSVRCPLKKVHPNVVPPLTYPLAVVIIASDILCRPQIIRPVSLAVLWSLADEVLAFHLDRVGIKVGAIAVEDVVLRHEEEVKGHAQEAQAAVDSSLGKHLQFHGVLERWSELRVPEKKAEKKKNCQSTYQ
ncbi:hypothetical protein BC936DRAFT_138031 [Jimgerdemannia flammicorona]|uniref:Uncharacterized protein n=1 Tax=Jimgerdemannia flammicorona TaxID=994334 RepID=A0A433CWA6_9FUNG|nr:hypothetical protein BC936DRAFT_138031 [Jimgerdemannia flammicorona]